jgi:hypothetical protein
VDNYRSAVVEGFVANGGGIFFTIYYCTVFLLQLGEYTDNEQIKIIE